MCEPVTLFAISAGLSAVSGVVNYGQQKDNAEAQQKWQEQLHKTNTEVATSNALTQYAALQRRELEERAAAAQGVEQVSREALQATGRARAGAAAGGVGGLSVDSLMSDFQRQELDYQTSVIRNQGFREQQFAAEAEGIKNQAYGQILSSSPQPVAKPDFFGTLLQIGGDTLGAYSQYGYFNKDTGKFGLK